ncbi:cytochrome P450 CYP645A1 [Stachybotrys elegans]|uniref:Cytochrome P450 CYP645A1 n=1 Tax=Stachybotrys elegans TaxID=80388 RepID=A0A8K0WWU8_9HYPO|nr:cytochrome P450 CYP645A1 [Stachybotrys elegans]
MHPQIDLTAPFEVDRLLELRTSRMKKMSGLTIESGIDKTKCPGPMKINKLGLEGDEHDLTFHGGPDKAILGYCSSHYPSWRESYPESADRFVPGGFGENFVTERMNERNVCIGDVISVGPEVLLQVSLPRQPCFKLNHRFSLKNFAPKTYESSRTGWYYRVLREGTVNVGDELRLVERKWPEWTVERVQEYLHRDQGNLEMNKKLAEVEALGDESRNQFRRRVAKAAAASKPKKTDDWRDFKITARKMETQRIVSLVLEAVDPNSEEAIRSRGTQAKIRLPNGLVRTYSIVSGDDDFNIRNKLELGVALDANSRGGSQYLHEQAKAGDIIQVGNITADVSLASDASNHIFIVGGIGITAFMDMIKVMQSINFNFQLHYAVRSADDIPFRDRLEPLAEFTTIYDKSKGQRMDIKRILETMPWNSHIYVCGPDRMMEATKVAVKECGISPNEVHFEAFAADISGDPFEAVVANKEGKVFNVGEEESLLEVLRREYPSIASSCEAGNCGTCKIGLASGRVDHRGTALSEEEKKVSMLSCVSRGIGSITIEI